MNLLSLHFAMEELDWSDWWPCVGLVIESKTPNLDMTEKLLNASGVMIMNQLI